VKWNLRLSPKFLMQNDAKFQNDCWDFPPKWFLKWVLFIIVYKYNYHIIIIIVSPKMDGNFLGTTASNSLWGRSTWSFWSQTPLASRGGCWMRPQRAVASRRRPAGVGANSIGKKMMINDFFRHDKPWEFTG
jgi:hypothetical protein